MSSLASVLSFIIILSMIIIFMASILSKKTFLDREKSSPFECGFDPFSLSRIPFSLRFFMIGIIFLIFDVEIAILLPIPLLLENLNSVSWNTISLIITIILLIGLLHEWNFGALDWAK